MTTSTLRPNAAVSGMGSITLTGGASAQAVTSDDSDATYFIGGGWTSSQSWGKLNVGTVTLPAGAVTKTVTTRARWRTVSGSPVTTANARTVIEGTFQVSRINLGELTTTVTDSEGPATAWILTQAQIDTLQIWVNSTTLSGANLRVHELYVDLTYATIPTLNVTGPTGTINTSETAVTWEYTQGSDGGPQTWFRVAIFTSAVYGGGGFDPETSTSLYDSGDVASNAETHTTGPLAEGTTHRAYVKVAQTTNAQIQWSAWDSIDFTVDTTPPTLTVVALPSTSGSLEVTVTRSGGGAAWTAIEVQRSFDSGTTWEFVRGANMADATNSFATYGASTFVVNDYEVANATSVLYRARAANGVHVSGWTSSSSTAWSSGFTWLKSIVAPAGTMAVSLLDRPVASRARRRGVFPVLGRSTPVIVADVQGSRTGTFTIQTTTTTEAAEVLAVLAESVLLLQLPAASDFDDLWLSVGDVTETFVVPVASSVVRHWEVAYDEVDRPPDAIEGA